MHRRAASSAHSCTPCTHTTVQPHSPSIIVKFSDDTTVIGLITDNDETAYREEVSILTKWCQENHLSLNIDKTKELVVDYRRQSREHTPITIDKTPVERLSSFKFLGVHITEDLTWSAHTDAVLKKAHQRLFFLRWLRKFGTSPRILRSFYTCTVESILTGYIRWCIRKARRISLLPSGRRLRNIQSRTSRLRDSFFPQAIRLMNSKNEYTLKHTPTLQYAMHCTLTLTLTQFNWTTHTHTHCTNTTTYLLTLDTIQDTHLHIHDIAYPAYV